METRRLGRTGNLSSSIIFGGFALLEAGQREADAAIDTALQAGLNHFDVSPIYGGAEARLGDWIKRHSKSFFLACKTLERTKTGARESLEKSLEKLHVDHIDLYQFHSVDDDDNLNTILGEGGALEAVLEAKKQGLVRFIGITGHSPSLQYEALQRFEFDTVMFPLNRVHAAHATDWNDFRPILTLASERDVGIMAIKSVAKRTWPNDAGKSHRYITWYEPFDTEEEIRKSLWYTLSQDITAAVTPGDLKLWPMVFEAARRFQPLSREEQEQYIAEASQYRPLAAPGMD